MSFWCFLCEHNPTLRGAREDGHHEQGYGLRSMGLHWWKPWRTVLPRGRLYDHRPQGRRGWNRLVVGSHGRHGGIHSSKPPRGESWVRAIIVEVGAISGLCFLISCYLAAVPQDKAKTENPGLKHKHPCTFNSATHTHTHTNRYNIPIKTLWL